jgi:hypothetical protein
MKFTHVMILLVIVLAFAMIAAAPFQTETPPATPTAEVTPAPDGEPVEGDPLTVPVELEMAFTAIVVFLVTAGVKAISQAFPKIPNLEGQATVFAGAIVAFVIALANAALLLLPPDLVPYARLVFGAIVTWLGANGIALLLKKPATK